MTGKSGNSRRLSPEAQSRVMASIRSKDTRPELLLRGALWRHGARGWRCNWRGPAGWSIDVAFTRWRLAVFVDGSFWHGHPSKWQPGRWKGYWVEKIKRNIDRDRRHDSALCELGWVVIRAWDFEIEQDPDRVAATVIARLNSIKDAKPNSRPLLGQSSPSSLGSLSP